MKSRGKEFRIHVVAHESRDLAIDCCKDLILGNGGGIVDFKIFSNLSLSMLVEIPAFGALRLIGSLETRGWHVEVEPELAQLAPWGEQILEGTMQLTFPEGDGEVRVIFPSVTG